MNKAIAFNIRLEAIAFFLNWKVAITEIAEELDIDIALVDQFVTNQNH